MKAHIRRVHPEPVVGIALDAWARQRIASEPPPPGPWGARMARKLERRLGATDAGTPLERWWEQIASLPDDPQAARGAGGVMYVIDALGREIHVQRMKWGYSVSDIGGGGSMPFRLISTELNGHSVPDRRRSAVGS